MGDQARWHCTALVAIVMHTSSLFLFLFSSFTTLIYSFSLGSSSCKNTHATYRVFSDYAYISSPPLFICFLLNHPLQRCVSMPLRLSIVIFLPSQMLLSIVVVYENRLLLFHLHIYWSPTSSSAFYIFSITLYFNASKHKQEKKESR